MLNVPRRNVFTAQYFVQMAMNVKREQLLNCYRGITQMLKKK